MSTNKDGGKSVIRDDLLFRDEVYAIIGAAIEVHNELGARFLEGVYQEALELEFRAREIPFEPQTVLRIKYKNQILKKEYCADFICYGKIIVEIKSMKEITGREIAQLLNYLKATGFRLGLLINFGDSGRLDWHRLVF